VAGGDGVRRLSDERVGERRVDREREDEERDGRPDERRARQRGPPEEEEDDERRRRQRAPHVVEDLPAPDDGERVAPPAAARVAYGGEQPREELPVAADPAVEPHGPRAVARGVVVEELEVRDERGAGVVALEEVVREDGVLGD